MGHGDRGLRRVEPGHEVVEVRNYLWLRLLEHDAHVPAAGARGREARDGDSRGAEADGLEHRPAPEGRPAHRGLCRCTFGRAALMWAAVSPHGRLPSPTPVDRPGQTRIVRLI